MIRSLIVLFLGVLIGAVLMWVASRNIPLSSRQLTRGSISTPEPALVRCESELARRDQELNQLRRVNLGDAAKVVPAEQAPTHEVNRAAELEDEDAARQAVAWQLSSVEKFVPVSDEQRARLTQKFAEERKAREEGRESSAESLEEIIGVENAQVYRGQVKAAFERVRNEELDKDAVWLSRRLGLAPEQELRMRSIFEDVERVVSAEYAPPPLGSGTNPQQRVQRMIAENRRRVELRAERLREVLPADQYQAYIKSESESAASDMEVFHDSGEH